MSISPDVATTWMISSLPFPLAFQRLLGGVIRALPSTKSTIGVKLSKKMHGAKG